MASRIKEVLIQRIVGIDDTPHRIAWGVFLGCAIGATPTLGLQILIYVAAAAMLRANKVSGVPFVLLVNPLTAIPVYYFEWRVGAWLMGEGRGDAEARALVIEQLTAVSNDLRWPWDLFSARFWGAVFEAAVAMGEELWVGCLAVGLSTGALGYAVTYWAVVRFREVRAEKKARASLPPEAPAA